MEAVRNDSTDAAPPSKVSSPKRSWLVDSSCSGKDIGQLIRASSLCDEKAATSRHRRRRRVVDNVEQRAARVEALVQMGELSSARQALDGAISTPWTCCVMPPGDPPDQERRSPKQFSRSSMLEALRSTARGRGSAPVRQDVLWPHFRISLGRFRGCAPDCTRRGRLL